MFADLHLHTRHSDGTYTPVELVATARRVGLTAIAVTDHDTLEGCAEVGLEAARHGLDFVPGTEVTTELDGRELHILAYFVNDASEELRSELAVAQGIRQARIRDMVSRLNAAGVGLQVEDVFRLANCSAPGRPHVARALVAGRFCRNLDEAFDRYLKKDRPGWVPKRKMSVVRALELIHGAGGVAVMAHPGLNHDDSLIDRLAAMGLDGLECFHPKHSIHASAKYEGMAVRLGLLITGGSDCHGVSKNRPTIGTVRLPIEHLDRLRARHQARRAALPGVAGASSGSLGSDPGAGAGAAASGITSC